MPRTQGNPASPQAIQQPVANPKIVLCISGFDPCGGAGLLADARAVRAFGAYALGVQTALVPQNTVGVAACVATPPALLRQQLELLSADIEFDVVKIGLLPDAMSIEIVADFLAQWKVPIVVDPVLAPTRGQSWSDASTLDALRAQILPLATLLTPNVPEAQILGDLKIEGLASMERAARVLRGRSGSEIVLLKGGHLENRAESVDVYASADGIELLRAPRVMGMGVRGTGCLLASAIAAQLAAGVAPLLAAKFAKEWMTTQWRDARVIGQGRRIAIF